MDLIPFEKVSLEEAKAVLDQGVTPSIARNWAMVRASRGVKNMELATPTVKWITSLPEDVRPRSLAKRFPRITNKLADLWKRPLYCERYLDTLLLDDRESRNGFPPKVGKELARLKIYLIGEFTIQHYDVWGDRIGS